MNYVLMIANGVTMTSAMVCTAYFYKFYWRSSDYRKILISMVLIGLTAIITGLQFVFPEILTALSRNKEALLDGEWWRMVTPLFVQPHGFWQCVFNGAFMLTFLPVAEKVYGKRLLALYFIPGIVGQAFNYIWGREGGGSSTAIYGVMGALLMYVCRHRNEFPRQYFPFAIAGLCGAVALCFVRDGHAPGLLTGALLATMMPATVTIDMWNSQVEIKS